MCPSPYDFAIRELVYESVIRELTEANYKLNACTLPLEKARAYAEGIFRSKGKSLNDVIPSFDRNYVRLQKKCRKALNIPRIRMPVIEPKNMKEFDARLKKGRLDIFQPYAKGKLYTPSLTPKEGRGWVSLGVKDGSRTDDVVKAKWVRTAGSRLLPTQSQIWLEKLVSNIASFGVPKAGSPILDTTVIMSKEGYILDGHHRFGQVMLADPSLKIRTLFIPLEIALLLKIGRSYGGAVGNRPKA